MCLATVTLRNQTPISTLRIPCGSQVALGLLHEDYDLQSTIPWSYASGLTQSSSQTRPTIEPTPTDPPDSGADISGGDTHELSDIPEESSSLDGATLNETPSAPHRSRSRSRGRDNQSPPQRSYSWSQIMSCGGIILAVAAGLGLTYLVYYYALSTLGFVSPYIEGSTILANGTAIADTTQEMFDPDPIGNKNFKRQHSETEEDAEVIRKARVRQHEQAKAAEAKDRVNEVFGSVAYHNAQLSKLANAQKTHVAHGHGKHEPVADAAAREQWYEHAMAKAQREREDEERREMNWLAKWNPVEWRRRKQAEKQATLSQEATEELERYGSQFRNHDKMLRPPIKKRTLRDRVDAIIGWAWLVY